VAAFFFALSIASICDSVMIIWMAMGCCHLDGYVCGRRGYEALGSSSACVVCDVDLILLIDLLGMDSKFQSGIEGLNSIINNKSIRNHGCQTSMQTQTIRSVVLVTALTLSCLSYDLALSSPVSQNDSIDIVNVNTTQAVETFVTSSINSPPNGGGCILTYLDENFQPIQPVSTTTNQSATATYNSFILQQANNYQQQQQQQQLIQPSSIGLDCQYITAEQLHEQFNKIKAAGLKVSSLIVKDSTLTTLSNLPQGFHELKKLSISNTSIDLEVLKEGSESLDQLTTLEITNEKISNIPQNFFQEMQSLRELRLENDGIASLDGDAFHNLDDSLEVLVLRKNRFNRFPMAVKNLAQLAVLDLSDNDIVIDTQENDLPEKLEPLLNLRELLMNRINCTCEFSSSPFFEWIARTHISGVRCFSPEKLKSQEVIVFERDEFCARQSSGGAYSTVTPNNSNSIWLMCQLTSMIVIYSLSSSSSTVSTR
jgi:hypothetical protein